MPRLFNVTNHSVTDDQRADAIASLGVGDVVDMPPDIARCWGTVPPELDSVCGYVQPVIDWLSSQATKGDVVWVQGEWGAVITVVAWCEARDLRAVYATTKREATEIHGENGVQMTHVFRHVRFRDFPKLGAR
ncbi:conserved hypothetical protein [Fibrobacter succinogenes subsp. succinogenes S85]|uniref:Uncharacterized protein n=1 Tax=Fibrobacter succinogenes (strain ATCC 19169 / S85) TaxID=59374 RepID=C9RRH2_FIBSS|nr:CRISPR-associated protein Csx20 [Fibrobacter succinogenes]ACX75158.1 conserved hypothetical protein [Fibrobacter succinogenes subsp. succinogenes S85]ADL24791.1 conserved hypothetical protein [Fibrobacter succinogenes subsp. succinogenes S85]